METIADFPAYRIYKPFDGRKFRHGEKIALPFNSRSHGVLWHFFTLGTVAGYAVQNGEDPEEAIARCKRNMAEQPHAGHRLYWANANAVSISNMRTEKESVPGFNFGDSIILQGKTFRIERAPNDNINLVEE